MAGAEVEASRFLGPKTGRTLKIAHTSASASTNLSSTTCFADPPIEAGHYVTLISTTAVQFAFGDSAVTVGTSDPYLPADTPFSVIPQGKYLGLKSISTSGDVYIWPSSATP